MDSLEENKSGNGIPDKAVDEVGKSAPTELSKRALKKLKKRQEWLDSKKERRENERAKRKVKMAKRKAENPDLPSYSSARKILKKSLDEKTPCGIHVVFDMSFAHLMNQRDRGKCLKQIMRCYSLNRRLEQPLTLYGTSFDGVMKEEMGRHDGYENWKNANFTFLPNSYTSLVERSDNSLKEKSDIVYLSSESENVVQEFSTSKMYVIGGLVDHNKHKGLCYKLAKEAGVAHARLPLDKHVDLKTRRVLTIDHVFQIISDVVEGKSWKDAILKTLPERKGVIAKDDKENPDTVSIGQTKSEASTNVDGQFK